MMEKIFEISMHVEEPIVVGQDAQVGRRQLIPIVSGTVKSDQHSGHVLPGGVDSQCIDPTGKCTLSARYAIQLNDGATIYIENNGIRTVPESYKESVINGGFVDSEVYYFRTTPTFETYNTSYKWLMEKIFVGYATRTTDQVLLTIYMV
ncbi:DUF3237 domain-containing protein [Staphylococcus gallinarum]|uniref:DUF3237 domain-containing protein n=2 Tax=Staphylococcus gallinarum TaxID=1293 RepID=UPI000D1DE39B|nr:DUF3237 domain-containing protein [Staphylococcus gallinarum]PTK94837.1 DUF3237 domain-containing protein [Staphylococcus gallinarum]PTK95344.1 DUF3237 domain-containing protein [Staphylococcus gallinarum]RIO91238.1 DUF3237 domain-containing protein [Staphylococcus gallinarum]